MASLRNRLKRDFLKWDDEATQHVSTHTLETAWEVLQSNLDPEEIRIHTLRRRGYTAAEICGKLNISPPYYSELHNKIEEQIHRLYPIEETIEDEDSWY